MSPQSGPDPAAPGAKPAGAGHEASASAPEQAAPTEPIAPTKPIGLDKKPVAATEPAGPANPADEVASGNQTTSGDQAASEDQVASGDQAAPAEAAPVGPRRRRRPDSASAARKRRRTFGLTQLLALPAIALLLLLGGGYRPADTEGDTVTAAPTGGLTDATGLPTLTAQPWDTETTLGGYTPLVTTSPDDLVPIRVGTTPPGGRVTTRPPVRTSAPVLSQPPVITISPTATVGVTPTVTATSPSVTVSASSTGVPTVTVSASVSASPTASASPTRSASPTASASPTTSASPTGTGSPTPIVTLTANPGCPTIRLTMSSLAARVITAADAPTLEVVGDYAAPSATATGQTVIHAEARASATSTTPLTESDTTVPTRPGDEPAVLARIDLGELTTTPSTLTLTLTTSPARCNPVTLATVVIVGITNALPTTPPTASATPDPPAN